MDEHEPAASATNSKTAATPSSIASTSEHTTEAFDPNKFQPEFLGGFKPIYPPETTATSVDTKPIEAKTTKLDEEDSIESLFSDFLSGDEPENTTSN